MAFVAQLFGVNRGDFNRHERHEEVIITQMEVIRRSLTNVLVVFFWRRDEDQFMLSGRWLYYGLYRMLVLKLGGSLLRGALSARKLGVSGLLNR